MSKAPYLLQRPPAWTSRVIFCSPHSGAAYPDSLIRRSVLDRLALRSSEDAYVDRLFAGVTDFGAVMLSATLPRAWVDLNRRSDEFDPALIEGAPRGTLNPRVASGLGVIPRVVAGGRAIYHGKITKAEADARIANVWAPYHACLETLTTQARARFGEAILLDCHSMPHEALGMVRTPSGHRPEIVIGDRYGASARASVVEQIEEAFRAEGFRVARNTPFAGAYVAQHYGRPSRGLHAVQVEIDRSLYMTEATLERRPDFGAFQARVLRAARTIAALGREQMPLAAE